MAKKLYVALGVFIILGGIGLGYLLYERVSAPVSKAIMAIPSNAALILESEDFPNIWSKLYETSNYWNKVQELSFGNEIKEGTDFLDSLMKSDPRIRKNLQSRPAIITAHLTGSNSFHFLFLVEFDNTGELSEINSAIGKIKAKAKTRLYEGVTIHEIGSLHGSVFSYAFCKGIFMGSFSPGLVEDAIRQLESGTSLFKNTINPGFEVVHFTTDNKADGNLYISYSFFPKLLGHVVAPERQKFVNQLSEFANWTALDLMIRPNSILLNGLTHPNDSSIKYLNLFTNQSPIEVEITKVIPDNTLAFYFLGLEDIPLFYSDYRNYLDNRNKLFDHNKAIDAINSSLEVDLAKELLPLLSGELAIVSTGDLSSVKGKGSGKLDNFIMTGMKDDHETAISKLSMLLGHKNKLDQDELYHEDYRGYKIYSMNAPNLWGTCLGGVFQGSKKPFYTVIDQYAVFGESIRSMRNIIGAFIAGRTLKKEINYTLFSENISSSANCFAYYNLPLCIKTGLLQSSLSNTLGNNIMANMDTLAGFESLAIQVSKSAGSKRLMQKGNLFYTNLYLSYKDGYKEKEQLFTQTQLDAAIKNEIWVVQNHYTKKKEVLVQDVENKIYLIDMSGQILWKKQLNEPILGSVHQIDIYKNNKLQLLFNTASQLHLLDRKGRTVEKYPVKLPAPASNGLSLFDYDNNKKYRILIACENRKIYNYDKYGAILKGWEFNKTESRVTAAIQHFSLKGKDYILALDGAGAIYILDRRGNKRKSVSGFSITPYSPNFWIEIGSSINNTKVITADSMGTIYTMTLNGKKDSIPFGEFTYPPSLSLMDIDNDKNYDYAFLDKTELSVYNSEGALLFDEPFELNAEHGPIVRLVNGELKVGVASEKSETILLYDSKGVLHEGFPLYGNSQFEILKDEDQYKLITGVPGNYLYIYTLE